MFDSFAEFLMHMNINEEYEEDQEFQDYYEEGFYMDSLIEELPVQYGITCNSCNEFFAHAEIPKNKIFKCYSCKIHL